jgi:CBS domain containing-hemolysin-like protein
MELISKLLLVFILVLLNGFFVASEFAIVSVRKTRIAELARRGNKAAKLVSRAHKNLGSIISATQLGITLASLALGWVGEPAVAHFFEPLFQFLPPNAALLTSHSLAIFVAFLLITVLHVVIGEVVPKTIALQKAEAVSLLIITPLTFFSSIFSPFIWFLRKAGEVVLKVFRFSQTKGNESIYSEEEIKMILVQSVEGGAIEPQEAKMASRVFRLADILVKEIMVPRPKVVALDVQDSFRTVVEKINEVRYSRFPVYKESIDNVIGFIHVKDIYLLMKEAVDDTKILKANLIRPIIYVSQTKKIDDVLLMMQRRRIHIAVINNEYGGTAGIVTLEDILESVVGEIEDEFDTVAL